MNALFSCSHGINEQNSSLLPQDGISVRQIISQASTRQDIFINIDNFYRTSGSRFYNGTAIRVGDLKLLMAVRNHR